MKLEAGKYYWLRKAGFPESFPQIGLYSNWTDSGHFWLCGLELDKPVGDFDVLGEVEAYAEPNRNGKPCV